MSLPLLPGKYGSRAYIEPDRFLQYARKNNKTPDYEIPPNIIFYYIPTQIPHSHLNQKSVAKRFFNARLDLIEELGVAVVSQFGFGAPALAIQLELLIALGAKNFIGVGTSGSLLGDVKVGDFILCTKALRDEGVSYHYAPPSEFAFPDDSLCDELRVAFRTLNTPYSESPTWTTDAIYRETLHEVEKYRSLGVHTVDMEASALFTVARYRGVRAASLFAISDLLVGSDWEPHLHSMKAPLEQLMDVAITALNR